MGPAGPDRPPIRINAVVVGLATGIVSTWMFYTERSLTSIGAVDSLLMSIVAYIILQKLTGRGWAANAAEVAG